MSSVRIPLNSRKYPGLFAVIDEEDYELVCQYSWWPYAGVSGFYAATDAVGRLHRFLMNAQPGEIVDHINRDTLDNRRSNLRFATSCQNNRNRRANRGSTSPYKGVSACRSRWCSSIGADGKQFKLGTFGSQKEAALVYDVAARELHGEFAKLNFPDEDPAPWAVKQWHKARRGWLRTSAYKGVYKDSSRGRSRWVAQIHVNGSTQHIGSYKTEVEAALAFDRAALSIRGENATINFPLNVKDGRDE